MVCSVLETVDMVYSVLETVDMVYSVLETVDMVYIEDRRCLNVYLNRVSPEYKLTVATVQLVRSDTWRRKPEPHIMKMIISSNLLAVLFLASVRIELWGRGGEVLEGSGVIWWIIRNGRNQAILHGNHRARNEFASRKRNMRKRNHVCTCRSREGECIDIAFL